MSSAINRRDFLKLASLLPLLQAPGFAAGLSRQLSGSPLPNILLVIFDTLSANHMSLYGYGRETTPQIARFAGQAHVYHAHYAASNFTSPGTASIFTGAYPWSHKAYHLHGTVSDDFRYKNFFSLLAPQMFAAAYSHNILVTSLLDQFKDDLEQFMTTRALALSDPEYSDRIFGRDYNVSYWSEAVMLKGSGKGPGSLFLGLLYKMALYASKAGMVRQYGDQFPLELPNRNDAYYILDHGIDWMIANLPAMPQPFLGYFHFFPPHEPYTPRRDFLEMFAGDGFAPPAKPAHFASEGRTPEYLDEQRRLYDAHIAYVDAEFGRLMDRLAQAGMLENTYVILTSDHGELFEREIRGHVTPAMYEPLIHVPLLVAKPGQRERIDILTPTSCVDLLPTLAQIAGLPKPEWTEGEILPGFEGGKASPERVIFSLEAKSNPKQGPLRIGTLVMIKGQYKLIHYMRRRGQDVDYELYDLAQDPQELEDLYPTRTQLAGELQREMGAKLDAVNRG